MWLDAAATDSNAGGAVGAFVFVVILAIVYFLPTAVARSRKTINSGGVFVLNLLLGWTILGWIIAMAMAAGGMTQEQNLARSAPPPPGPNAPVISPDGKHWWNGREWLPLPAAAPEFPPETSQK